ncbi:MAG: metallophosphoesterase [Planctomycetota bacterium]|nr:metallophosphoesterase [Planctomycetota bacterium]
MNLVWITDPHLNFCSEEQIAAFLNSVAETAPDAVLLGGDIGEADSVERLLRHFEDALRLLVYLVLGNHDFYRGSIREVRKRVSELCKESDFLNWLPDSGVIELDEETCLIGHDGWGDGRLGTYHISRVELNDFRLIRELKGLDKYARYEVISGLGDEAALHIRQVLPEALERFRNILVLTHVPPWKEACWHEGRISEPDWLPFFACWAAGVELKQAMETRPDRRMLVLCGHTHSDGVAQILPNLRVLTGASVYGQPRMQEIIDVDNFHELVNG